MILTVENVWTHAACDVASDEREWLAGVLSAETSQFVQGRYGQDDTWIRQTQSVLEGDLFPSGVVPVVMRRAQADGLLVQIEDRRVVPQYVTQVQPMPGWLRDYQQAAIERVVKWRRGILRIPMAGGKTAVFVGLTLVLPCEWLYLVKQLDLVQQTIAEYAERTGETAGTLVDGQWRRGSSNVTVAGFDAWWAGLKRGALGVRELGESVEAVNVDECHKVSAETLYRGLLALPNAYVRVGQSGTPLEREEFDNLRVIGAFGPVIYRLETQELVHRGIVAKATVRMVACKQDVPRERQAATWRGVHTQFIVGSTQRNRLVAQIARQAAKPCLVFVEKIKHGQAILREIERLGIKSAFVHGQASLGQRRAAVERLVSGELDVLVANEIFSTGLNAPDVRSTVNAAGGQAVIGVLQRMGRAMRRKSDGSLDCETWDLDDSGHCRVSRGGHVTDWLERHARARQAAYEQEGHEVQLIADLGLV